MVCMWVEATFLFSLEHIHINWLRYHTSWAQVELEWRLRMFPSTSNLCICLTAKEKSSYFLCCVTHSLCILRLKKNLLIFLCSHTRTRSLRFLLLFLPTVHSWLLSFFFSRNFHWMHFVFIFLHFSTSNKVLKILLDLCALQKTLSTKPKLFCLPPWAIFQAKIHFFSPLVSHPLLIERILGLKP